MSTRRDLPIWLAIFASALLWSIYQPYEVITWWLETTPILLLLVLLAATYGRLPLTPLSYGLLTLGAVLVFIGAHYTYARVPAFDWLQDAFHLRRNHYDRFGHFFQGLIPAIVFRELLLRTSPLRQGSWVFVIVTALCMAKSMLYEFAEWWTAALLGMTAHEFLGTQGDEWDAQMDMLLATLGAMLGLWLLGRRHDRQLARLENDRG